MGSSSGSVIAKWVCLGKSPDASQVQFPNLSNGTSQYTLSHRVVFRSTGRLCRSSFVNGKAFFAKKYLYQ